MSLPTPSELRKELPLRRPINAERQALCDILWQRDPRWLIITGPCSIHDETSAIEYGKRLAQLGEEVKESALIVMRTYFEKPRTQGGWKGFLTDPDLDGSCQIGLRRARSLCLELIDLGLPLATEFLNPSLALYLEDCMTWGCIGARTTASQPHRQLASRLACPIGFKNSIHGRLEPAIFSIKEASCPQVFFGIDNEMRPQRIEAPGNESAHLVLRGSDERPNYTDSSLRLAAHLLEEQGIETAFIVDCAHGNSQKNPYAQEKAMRAVLASLSASDLPLAGFMFESHLHAGSQPLTKKLRPGVSITDPCLDFNSTRKLILELAAHKQRSLL